MILSLIPSFNVVDLNLISGSFRVEMDRASDKDRTIRCRYNPTESGLYSLEVKWSGKSVPGSPFNVHVVNTQEELERLQAINHL